MISLDRVQALPGIMVVEPWYENDENKIGSLYLPGGSTNPMSQIGKVVKAHADDEWRVGDIVLYHPFHAVPFRFEEGEHFFVHRREWCGFVAPDGEPFPPSNCVVILPTWSPREEEYQIGNAKLVRLNRWHERPEPPRFGTVLRTGTKVAKTLKPGTIVVLPKVGGWEVGIKSTVFYFIPANLIEVTVA